MKRCMLASYDNLAHCAYLGLITARNFKSGKITPHEGTLRLLRETFEHHGITFITEGGVGVVQSYKYR